MNSLFVEDTANVHQNNVIIDERLLCHQDFDLKNIESKFEHLMIDKKRSKFKLNKNNSNNPNDNLPNPFGKRKW